MRLSRKILPLFGRQRKAKMASREANLQLLTSDHLERREAPREPGVPLATLSEKPKISLQQVSGSCSCRLARSASMLHAFVKQERRVL